MYDIASASPLTSTEGFAQQGEPLLRALAPRPTPTARRSAGRPEEISSGQLWLGLLLCLLRGLRHQRDLWRLISWEGFWHFRPTPVCDQAISKRLAQEGLGALEQLWLGLSRLLEQRLAPYAQTTLAPFAKGVYALDETILDPVARLLAPLRALPKGDPSLLPGKIAALFDVRLQQWRDFRFLPDAAENCKVHAQELLRTVAVGSLLLFDRGYFSFPWFDRLSRQGYWWISRWRERTRYSVIPVYYQHGELFDGLIWLGATRDQAACAVRLVQFRLGHTLYRYLTNVQDPLTLPLADIARLYARRWDIELAFRLLKEHLGLRFLWSSKLLVIQQQCLACLLLVQLLQAFQVELAARAQVDPFDVSLPLLLKALPSLLQRRQDPMSLLLAEGRRLGIIRPSSRQRLQPPTIAPWQLVFPPEELILVRQARYAHSNPSHVKHKPRPDPI